MPAKVKTSSTDVAHRTSNATGTNLLPNVLGSFHSSTTTLPAKPIATFLHVGIHAINNIVVGLDLTQQSMGLSL